MQRHAFFATLLLCSAGLAPSAVADGASAVTRGTEPELSWLEVGARIGGYGFRNTAHPDKGDWDDCRMNGLGVFAQKPLTSHFFAEAAVDLYFARDAIGNPAAMDRLSGITTIAGGARLPSRWLSPYVQAGLGVEITHASMSAHGLDDHAVVPMGFLGGGLDIRVYGDVLVGGNLRANVMRHYDHGGDHHQDDAAASMPATTEIAMQAQFFLKLAM